MPCLVSLTGKLSEFQSLSWATWATRGRAYIGAVGQNLFSSRVLTWPGVIKSSAKGSFAMREEGIDPKDRPDTSDIPRREVLVTLGVLGGAVAAGAASW